MKIRIATTLLALMLPLAAQDPNAAATEAIFYKAFYLEKGAKDLAAAMVLYEQFLNAAPDHKLAKDAALQQFGLLGQTGKTKERDAFKAKYEKLLGNAAPTPAAGDRPAGGGADARPGRGAGAGGPGGDPAARIAELEKQLAKAKEEGNQEEVTRLTGQIERTKQMGARGGQGGAGGGRGAGFGALRGTKKLSEMTPEEITGLKETLAGSQRMVDGMRQNGNEEGAKKLETSIADLKKNLDANKLDEAQKSLDAIRAAMPARGGRGGGGGGGGGGNNGGGGGGGNNGGGGGNSGGGGGGGNSGGGGGGR